jgi:DNA-binding NarL/FixJ family response regulator
MASEFRTRVLVAEDEDFTLSLLSEILTSANFEVVAVTSVSEAIDAIDTFDPHAVITDLNFGANAPTGADLLNYVEDQRPWVGKVVLTSHASPALALPSGLVLPGNVIYLVKSELRSISRLIAAVTDSISKINESLNKPVLDHNRVVISDAQGDILRLMAEGLTNTAIAQRRGTSVRATEALIQRTFSALGLTGNDDYNPRILAVRMWSEDKIIVK